jgi:hypothetical protein
MNAKQALCRLENIRRSGQIEVHAALATACIRIVDAAGLPRPSWIDANWRELCAKGWEVSYRD